MKAILVTKENTQRLANQFDEITVEEAETFQGHWLLAEFGEKGFVVGVLRDEDFQAGYSKTAAVLQNGWVEVV